MHQKRNEATQIIWITSHEQFIRSGSQFKLPCGASLLERMRFLGQVNTKQCCEIQSMWNAWIQRRTLAEQEKHCVQRDSQKAFQSTQRHYLPWIYCSNTHCTMVLWKEMWDIHIELYYRSNGV